MWNIRFFHIINIICLAVWIWDVDFKVLVLPILSGEEKIIHL